MPEIIERKLVETTRQFRVELDGRALVRMLREQGHDIPDNATVTFTTPGGGDWSNTDIDIDDDHPVIVEWITRDVEGNLCR